MMMEKTHYELRTGDAVAGTVTTEPHGFSRGSSQESILYNGQFPMLRLFKMLGEHLPTGDFSWEELMKTELMRTRINFRDVKRNLG